MNIAMPNSQLVCLHSKFTYKWCFISTLLGLSPLPVAVTTRIITFLVGNPYKPSFPLLLGGGTTQNIPHKWSPECIPEFLGLFVLYTQREEVCHLTGFAHICSNWNHHQSLSEIYNIIQKEHTVYFWKSWLVFVFWRAVWVCCKGLLEFSFKRPWFIGILISWCFFQIRHSCEPSWTTKPTKPKNVVPWNPDWFRFGDPYKGLWNNPFIREGRIFPNIQQITRV